MQFLIDILDERLEALEAEAEGDDDRERLRAYLDMWRAGAIDPLRDPGAVVILTLDHDGSGPVPGPGGRAPRRLVANDGEGGYPEPLEPH